MFVKGGHGDILHIGTEQNRLSLSDRIRILFCRSFGRMDYLRDFIEMSFSIVEGVVIA